MSSPDSRQQGGVSGLVRDVWLFTRGAQSVRIVRIADDGRMRLLVRGPGPDARVYELPDVISCMMTQSEIERRLVADGFGLEQFTCDGRSDRGRRQARRRPERRRQAWERLNG